MKSDLISRQAAIDVADAVWSVTGDKNVAKVWDQIKDLPSAQPEQRWIPCSERLPDAGEYYFVTVQYYGWDCTECRTIGIAKYELDGWRSCHNVLAWMPFPAPYRPEGEKHVTSRSV